MTIAEKYGLYIKEKRCAKGMTQAEIAKKLGISQQAYSRYEQGKREPTLDYIKQIAQILGVQPGEFFNSL